MLKWALKNKITIGQGGEDIINFDTS